MVVDVSELKRVKEYLNTINRADFSSITWVEYGQVCIIPDSDKTIAEWTIMEDEELPRIELKLEIKRNSDGIIATDIWKDWAYNDYWFEEGNARCDCNRELFWLRAQGLLDGYKNTECGEDRYSLRLSNNSTGEILYNEIDETA